MRSESVPTEGQDDIDWVFPEKTEVCCVTDKQYIPEKGESRVGIIKTISGRFINYCYLITDNETRSSVLVDPAWEKDKIISYVISSGSDVKAILLTHSHHDHTNLAEDLSAEMGIPVFMSRKEIEYYSFSIGGLIPVDDGDIIELGEMKIQCILTSGHTAGGMCYMIFDSIFTGDTVFFEGCGDCGLAGGSAVEMYGSVRKLIDILSSHIRVYPGHSYGESPGKTFGTMMEKNIYFRIADIKTFVEYIMRRKNRLYKFK